MPISGLLEDAGLKTYGTWTRRSVCWLRVVLSPTNVTRPLCAPSKNDGGSPRASALHKNPAGGPCREGLGPAAGGRSDLSALDDVSSKVQSLRFRRFWVKTLRLRDSWAAMRWGRKGSCSYSFRCLTSIHV